MEINIVAVYAAIQSAGTLDELLWVLNEMAPYLDEQDRKNIDYSSLPTYGGDCPPDTYGIWSWDSSRQIIGADNENGNGFFEIVAREEKSHA